MKSRLVDLLFVLTLLLCACGAAEDASVYEVSHSGYDLVVDTQAQTITCGGDVVSYTVSGTTKKTIRLLYPDGSTYFRTYDSNGGYAGGWSDDYVEGTYVPGDVLMDVVTGGTNPTSSFDGANTTAAGILLLIVGIFNAAAPRTCWHLSLGWKFRDAEPSDLALTMGRVGGIAAAAIGLVLCFL